MSFNCFDRFRVLQMKFSGTVPDVIHTVIFSISSLAESHAAIHFSVADASGVSAVFK